MTKKNWGYVVDSCARTVALFLPKPSKGFGLYLKFNAAIDAAGIFSIAILSADTLQPINGFSPFICTSNTLVGNISKRSWLSEKRHG